jgi:hypothetical protein
MAVATDLIAAFDRALPDVNLHTIAKSVLKVARYERVRRTRSLIKPLRVYDASQSLYRGNMQRSVKSICERLRT